MADLSCFSERPLVSQPRELLPTELLWCLHCHQETELLDSDNGLSGERCARCHSLKVERRQRWTMAEPDAGRKAQKLHRLAPEKRSLREMTSKGYWFCNECQNVTEMDKKDRCTLCHSSKVEWHDPIFA